MTDIQQQLSQEQQEALRAMQARAQQRGFDVRLSADGSQVETFDPATGEVMFHRSTETALTTLRQDDA